MVDIQSPTAEISRGKKDRRKKKETAGQKYNILHRATINRMANRWRRLGYEML